MYHSSVSLNARAPVIQTLHDDYIGENKLIPYLNGLFGRRNWKARNANNAWSLQLPRKLTDDEIEAMYEQSSAAWVPQQGLNPSEISEKEA